MGNIAAEFIEDIPKVSGWDNLQMFNLNEDIEALRELHDSGRITHVSDCIEEAIEELYHIENPSQIDSREQKSYNNYLKSFGDLKTYGSWIYFPWNSALVHFPEKEDLRRLRTSRNRNLVTEDESKSLAKNKTILVLGLSVGSNVIDSLLLQGIGSRYILVDMDQLAPTNLNRIRATYDQIGIHKVDVVAKKISEVDPYLEQIHYKEGLNEDNLEQILTDYKPDIIIDEMDSLKMKLIVRVRAKTAGIPVLMATDNGDNILLDIERYDLSGQTPILHGIMPQHIIDEIINQKSLDRQQAGRVIGQYFVGLDNVPVRMLESLLEVGRSLPSWPQLGGAAALSGIYLSYAVKKIFLKQSINSGRFLMGPEAQLNPELETTEYKSRKAELISFMKG